MKLADTDFDLNRMLAPVGEALNDEAAGKLLRLRADRRAAKRVEKLARKNNNGDLTADENDEYLSLVIANDIIAILQAYARVRLNVPSAA